MPASPGPPVGQLDRMIEYSAAIDRPPFELPGGAEVAVIIAVNVEHYEFRPPANQYKNEYLGKTRYPDVVGYGYRDYGNRVGLWRMLEVLDAFDCRVTCALNTAVLSMFPQITAAMVERDWTYMFHGTYNTRYLFGAQPQDELAMYLDAIQEIRRHTGKQVRGVLGPGFSSSENSPRLLREAGMSYTMDWFVDDRPFLIDTPAGSLVGVPYSRELNDSAVMSGPPYYALGGEFFRRSCQRQYEVLRQEPGGRVMTLAVHPFLLGLPDQIGYLHDTLDWLSRQPGIWWTTPDEVTDLYLSQRRTEVYG